MLYDGGGIIIDGVLIKLSVLQEFFNEQYFVQFQEPVDSQQPKRKIFKFGGEKFDDTLLSPKDKMSINEVKQVFKVSAKIFQHISELNNDHRLKKGKLFKVN